MDKTFDNLKAHNFWEGKALNTGFKRQEYLSEIAQSLNNRLIKVLIGQRRVGKSYLMRQIIAYLIQNGTNAKNIFYLNKEYIEFDTIRTYIDLKEIFDLYLQKIKPKGKIYVLVDEVQEIERWEKFVNSISQNHTKNYEVIITGSNSTMLSSEFATYISGRYIAFEILSFTYSEFIKFTKSKIGKESFLNYLKSGGLPELFNLEMEETKHHYISSLKDTILFKDIVQRFNIKNTFLLENIFKFIVNNVGSMFSVNKVVNYFKSKNVKTNYETVSNYVSYLKQTYLIHEVSRFDIRGKTILTGDNKYYLNDIAFRNYLSSSFSRGLGHLLENVVYLHFRSLGYQVYVGSINQKEVDFVIEKQQEKKYIQVCYLLSDEQVIAREFGNLESIHDHYEKIVVSMDDVSFGNRNGIKHICVWDL